MIENSENVIECDIKRMPYNPQTIHGKEVWKRNSWPLIDTQIIHEVHQ